MILVTPVQTHEVYVARHMVDRRKSRTSPFIIGVRADIATRFDLCAD